MLSFPLDPTHTVPAEAGHCLTLPSLVSLPVNGDGSSIFYWALLAGGLERKRQFNSFYKLSLGILLHGVPRGALSQVVHVT